MAKSKLIQAVARNAPFVDVLPPPLLLNRAPGINDKLVAGQIVIDTSVTPRAVYTSLGNGAFDLGGNAEATNTVSGIFKIDTDGTLSSADNTHVATALAAKTYIDSVAVAGAPVATEAVQGIGELSTDVEAVAGTASTALKALLVTPSNLTPVFAAAPAIGGTTPAAGTFTALTADGTGAVSLGANAASDFSVTGAGIDLTLDSSAGQLILTGGEAAANAVRIQADNAGGGIDMDAGTAGIIVDTTGAISLDSAAASNFTVTGAFDLTLNTTAGSLNLTAGESATDAIVVEATAGGIDILASGAAAGEDIDIVATGSSVNISSSEGVANALRLNASAGGIDVDAVGQVNIASSQSAASSIVVESTAGGVDILASGAAAGEDIDIVATGSSVNISSSESAVDSITIVSSAGGIDILASGAAAGEDIDIVATGSSVNIESTEAVVNAIVIDASNAAGGIDVDCGSGGFIVDAAAGAVSLDSALASNFTVTGAADLSLISTLGSVVVNAEEAAADAIQLTSAAGGLSSSVALQMSLVSTQAAGNAIVIDASNAAGGIDMDCGSGGFALDAAAGAISLDSALASNFTVTGAVDLTLSSTAGSVIINGEEAVADAIQIQSAAGGVDLDGALQVNIASSQNAADAIRINASAGGIDIDAAGAAGEDISLVCAAGSVFLSSGESAVDSIVLDATAGGIDILASGAAAGEDIDIVATGSSVNITSTESAVDAIVINASGAAAALQLDAGTGGVRFGTGLVVNVTAVDNGDTPYTVLGTDYMLSCDTSAGVLTVTLPAATALSGRSFLIKDMGGSAGANTLTIGGGGTNLVGGGAAAATKTITTNYAGARVTSNGTIWSYEYIA